MLRLPTKLIYDLAQTLSHIPSDRLSFGSYRTHAPLTIVCAIEKEDTYFELYHLSMDTFNISNCYGWADSEIELNRELLYTQTYLDEGVMRGIAEFIILGLYPGSLCEGLLVGKPYKELRSMCHVMSRCYLLNIVSVVDMYTCSAFKGISLNDVNQVKKARELIKTKGLHHYWIKNYLHYYLTCHKITAQSFVSPFNTSDITHKYFVHPLK